MHLTKNSSKPGGKRAGTRVPGTFTTPAMNRFKQYGAIPQLIRRLALLLQRSPDFFHKLLLLRRQFVHGGTGHFLRLGKIFR